MSKKEAAVEFKVDPNNFTEVSGNFDTIENSAVNIYLVQDNKTAKKYIKKEFSLIDDENSTNKPDSDFSSDNDDDLDDNVDNKDDNCDDYDDYTYDYSSYYTDSDLKPTNTSKYFIREVENLYKVQIKGLPFLRFYGYYFDCNNETKPFILTRPMKCTLGHLISEEFKECKNANTTKMKIFYGVAFALKILHSMGIIHRDIKPDNVFLNDENEPFLGDFGYARLIQESTKLTEDVGTSYYMAKELINSDSVEPTDKVDSYSFGVTLLETLTLNLKMRVDKRILMKNVPDDRDNDAFLTGETAKEKIRAGHKYIIPEDESVPDDFRKLIQKCWSDDERPSMGQIVEMMEKKKLKLPDIDEDEFDDYVKKLNDAKNKNERYGIYDDDDDDDAVNSKRKKKTKRPNKNKFKPKVKSCE